MNLLPWLADVLLGPHCPIHHCGHRTLHHHVTTTHPGWEPTP